MNKLSHSLRFFWQEFGSRAICRLVGLCPVANSCRTRWIMASIVYSAGQSTWLKSDPIFVSTSSMSTTVSCATLQQVLLLLKLIRLDKWPLLPHWIKFPFYLKVNDSMHLHQDFSFQTCKLRKNCNWIKQQANDDLWHLTLQLWRRTSKGYCQSSL